MPLPSAVTVRDSSPADATAVAGCIDVVSRERRYLGSVVGFSVEQTRAFIAELLESGGYQIIIVAADGVVAGWCDVQPNPFEGMRHVGRLGMGLLPQYRRRGLGRQLLREAIDRAKKHSLLRLELEVFASNHAAIQLYQQGGFAIEGRKRRARILDGIEDDILLMALFVPHSSG